jgi:hypothetical protein
MSLGFLPRESSYRRGDASLVLGDMSVAKNGRSKLGTRESTIHHQLDRIDV